MLDKLKKAANKVFQGGEEIDRILNLPITKLRIELKQAYQDKKFDAAQYDDFVGRLAKLASTDKDFEASFKTQMDVAKMAIDKREVESALDIEMGTPEKQLLWAATITRMQDSIQPGDPLVPQTRFWKQLEDTIGIFNEGIRVADVISKSLQNDDVDFAWGQPGSWFYFDPKENHINLDIYFSLLVGLVHARSVDLHEMGHAELSTVFSRRMGVIYEEIKPYIDPRTVDDSKQNDVEMPPERQKELALLVMEWQLRFRLWHMTEDNCVNQFSANMDGVLPQDFAYSLNHVSAVLQGFGEIVMGDDMKREVKVVTDKPEQQMKELTEKLDDARKKIEEERKTLDAKQKTLQAGTPEHKAVQDELKTLMQVEAMIDAKEQDALEKSKKFAAKMELMSRPLTDAEAKDVKAGNISPEIADKMFEQINRAVLLSYYEKNGMFVGKEKTWERFKVFPSDFNRTIDVSAIPEAKGKSAFDYLYDIAGGDEKRKSAFEGLPVGRVSALKHLIKRADMNETDTAALKEKAEDGLDAEKEVFNTVMAKIMRKDPAALAQLNARATADKDALDVLISDEVMRVGIRGLQPQSADRFYGKDHYTAKVADTSAARGVLMEHTWDTFLKPFADVLMREFEKEVDQDLKDQQDKKNQKSKPGQGKGQGQGQGQGKSEGKGSGKGSGSGGSGSESSGGDGDSDSEPQEKPDGEDGKDPKDGQEKKDGKGGQGKEDAGDDKDPKDGEGSGGDKPDDKPQSLSDKLKKQLGDMAQSPEEKRKKENAENSGEGKGQDKDKNANDNKGDGKDGKGQDADGKDPSSEGNGDEGNGESKNGKDKDGKGGPGWGQDPGHKPKPQRVGQTRKQTEINEDMTAEEKEKMRQEKADSMPEGGDLSSNQAGQHQGVDLAKLAKGDWRDFSKRIRELAPYINQVAEAFKRIREEQLREVQQRTTEHELMPRDGNFRGRLDRNKHLDIKFREASGQQLDVKDRSKFHKDKTTTMHTTIEITSMIDGSGSMPSLNLGNGVTAMEAALQSAVIVYMAARKAGIDSYIVMWGDVEPIVVATPKSSLKEVGAKLETLRKGTNSGTLLQPGIVRTIETQGEHKNPAGTISGSSHILVFSDGDIGDFAETVRALETVSKNSRNLTIDVALLRPANDRYGGYGRVDGKTQMESAFQTVIDRTGGRQVGILHGSDPNEIPIQLARMMLKRVRAHKVTGDDDSVKRKNLRQLAKKLKDNKP